MLTQISVVLLEWLVPQSQRSALSTVEEVYPIALLFSDYCGSPLLAQFRDCAQSVERVHLHFFVLALAGVHYHTLLLTIYFRLLLQPMPIRSKTPVDERNGWRYYRCTVTPERVCRGIVGAIKRLENAFGHCCESEQQMVAEEVAARCLSR